MNLLILFSLILSNFAKTEFLKERPVISERFGILPYWTPLWTNTTPAGLYSSATEKCCLGSVYPNKKPAYDKCCGSNVFDSSKQICCDEAVVPLAPGKSCCGQKTINTDSSTCCKGEEVKVASEVVPFSKCCGKKTYDTRSQSCCNSGTDSIVLEGANMLCCGNNAYEERKQICCADIKNETIAYRVLPREGDKTACCGEETYNPSKASCCGEKVAYGMGGCCAGTAYNGATHVCCNEKLTETNGKFMGCCGKEAFNRDIGICCSDYSSDTVWSVVTKTEKRQTNCCGKVPYDGLRQLCCDQKGKVINKGDRSHYQCCGDKSYSYNYGLCCDNVFYSNYSGLTHECCGSKPMDRRTNSCCGSQILDNSKSCCGFSEVYDTQTQFCCNEYNVSSNSQVFTVVPKTGNMFSCCGSKGYDYDKELCCSNKIFPKLEIRLCCGSQSYDTKKEVCCSEQTVFPKEKGRETCCLYGTTDVKPRYPFIEGYNEPNIHPQF